MPRDAQFRLSDFEIEEVSGVDRPANGEKFVLIKSENGRPVDEDKTKAKTDEAEAAAEEKADDEEPAAEPASEEPAAEEPAEEPAAEEPASGGGAPVHAGMLAEIAGALKKAVQNVIDAAMKGSDFNEAMAGMDSVWAMLSQIRMSATVVRLSKAAGAQPDPFAAVEHLILSKQAEIIRKARKVLKEEAAAAAEPAAEPAAEENPIEKIMGMLVSIEGKLDQLLQSQAKDAVGKALGELQTRITKMETAPVAPSTGGASGGARADARKEVVWPQDLNEG